MEVAKDESSSKALTTKIKERFLKSYDALSRYLLVFSGAHINPPHGTSLPVHMVDSEKKFCAKEVDLIIKGSAELLDGNNDSYPVISIVGAQSSGKSYLLNQLFGTKFPVMDGKLGWNQTTQGIMMAKCIGPSLLLLDVEGFGGANQQDISFQNQAGLFAFIVSDLMIVNMNICNISQEGGADTQFFRTIFQERERMQRAGLTELLVVLRNYCKETPLDILKTQVVNKLQKIWESANKKSTNFEDYIKVDIFGMPDKNSAEFPAEVKALRRLLSKNRSAKLPASTFTVISKEIWEKIQDNNNLVIPSNQEFIAKHQCQQLVERTLKTLDSKEGYMLLKAEQSPSCFRERSDALLERILTGYDLETEVYEPDVKDEIRKILIDELNKNFAGYAKKIILTIMESTAVQFKGEFDRIIKNGKPVDAKSSAEQIVQAYIVKFKSSCEDLKEFDDSDYLKGIYGQLEDQMQSYTSLGLLEIAERKEHEKKKGLNNIERKEHESKKGLNNIAHQKKAKEKALVQHAIIISVFASLALGSIGVAIAAACTGQIHAIGPAVSVVMASAGPITTSAIQLANRGKPSTSHDHDFDKSD